MSHVLLRLFVSFMIAVCLSLCSTAQSSSQQLTRPHSSHPHRDLHVAQQPGLAGLFGGRRGPRLAQMLLYGGRRPTSPSPGTVRGFSPLHERLAAREAPGNGTERIDVPDEDSANGDVFADDAQIGETNEELPPDELPPAEETYGPQELPPPPGYEDTGSYHEPFREQQLVADRGFDECGDCGDLGCDVPGGEACDSCGNCGDGACGECSSCWTPGAFGCRWCLGHRLARCKHQFSILAGVHGFKGPINRGGDGTFGFHDGINFAVPFGACQQFGWQLGFEGVHSNFHGANFSDTMFGNSTDSGRDQLFVTTGLYRRAQCGVQFGLVWDYLHESWDMDFNLGQIRGQLSWVTPWCHEVGFLFSTDTTDDTVNNFISVDTTDYYTFFYRYAAPGGGDGRLFAGWTEDSNGLIGADYELPVHHHWAIRSEFSYLVPDEGGAAQGNLRESWNVGISLVWYPGGNARANNCCTTRPLFRVANNGSLFTKWTQ